MLIFNLEGFIRMCKSRCEREFKEETKGRGVGLREFSTPWAKGMADEEQHRFPHSRRLKLCMPPACPWTRQWEYVVTVSQGLRQNTSGCSVSDP
jgi:hypothetical protein